MSLTKTDLQNIEAVVAFVVDQKLEEKLDQKLAPIKGELRAQGNDIKAIYHLLKLKQDRASTQRQLKRLELMITSHTHAPAA
ncbi:MAG: hypothetical protein ABIV43_03175 [Candidatus Saccharimonadales bacterium]